MVERKHLQQVLLSDVKQDGAMAASLGNGSVEACAIDGNLERRYLAFSGCSIALPRNQVSSVLAGIDPCLNDDEVLYQ